MLHIKSICVNITKICPPNSNEKVSSLLYPGSAHSNLISVSVSLPTPRQSRVKLSPASKSLLRGADAMRPLFQALIAEFGKPGAVFSMKQQSVEGEYAYILWTAETADNVYEMGTDTFVVRDGKIATQSFTSKITPKG